MKIKSIIIPSLLYVSISLISCGNMENHNVHFQPEEEIYVDELPESIMDVYGITSSDLCPLDFFRNQLFCSLAASKIYSGSSCIFCTHTPVPYKFFPCYRAKYLVSKEVYFKLGIGISC